MLIALCTTLNQVGIRSTHFETHMSCCMTNMSDGNTSGQQRISMNHTRTNSWNVVGNVRNIITGLRNQANDSLNKYDLCAWLHIEWSLHGVLATCNMPIISSEWLGSAKHSKVRGGKYWHMRCKTQQNVWVGLTVISLFLQNGTTHSKWMCDTRQPHTKVTSPYSQQYFEGNTFSGTTQIWRNTLMFEI